MTSRLNHLSAISLFVEDVAAAKAFYLDVFGAPVVYDDAVSAALKFDNLIVNQLQHIIRRARPRARRRLL